ncbi:hypothetical protein [Paenibacillus sp. 23TSA30-6]|uniref:hypothetical protein n=1 Tax=Paenibacillus sp. 23TSA30-6 TaxID=2546104 RepID=UPI0017887A64|nr:hypothetical protein [Paenibacillus sp. 23TSA30-6]MBE0338234.1 hypothetical protein [Paenibacillus sp. 23TSA30-6]
MTSLNCYPLADLANGRLEMLWAFGIDAMNDFTREYKTVMPAVDFTNLPYWDFYAALRPASLLRLLKKYPLYKAAYPTVDNP